VAQVAITRTRLVALAIPLALAVAACGGGDDDDTAEGTDATTAPTSAPEPSAAPATTGPATTAPATTAPTSAPATGGPITSYSDVQPAVVQIEARGTFRDPEIGYADGSGRGSGFIISPDGLAVTNNHVVAGAATLEVFVGGDTDDSYNARILGVSECNDLALIDIDATGELPHLDWHDSDIRAGLDVYAAGFPLGDPEFTLTRGIVAKAEAGGDITGTSSIDHTIEHDANIQPGNSGGPLVGADGKVVAVNYAGGAVATTTAQFYAIASDLAQPVIDELRRGDFESLGINGWAVVDEEAGISGIWVAGVAPGSPAAEAEVLPGDIITSMNGLPVGTDGTFKDYCDVIRTAGVGEPIAVDVLRYDTSEVLRGEINGDTPLEQAFSFADIEEEVVTDDTTVESASYSAYEAITDDTNRITMEVPVEWTDRDTAPANLDGVEVPFIEAAPDQQQFRDTFDVPGIQFSALPATTTVDAALTQFSFAESCTDGGFEDYSDAVFTGKLQVWTDCGETATAIVVLAATPEDGSVTAMLIAQIVTEADFEALQRAANTFNLVAA
jgi:serine protease Do